uniref:Uncharacterized protein n=1 Tax=Anguilla anguilla TaxID=7936 RepID=A0A0E9XT75_ANGAN
MQQGHQDSIKTSRIRSPLSCETMFLNLARIFFLF